MIEHDVEQRSETWYKLRLGIPSASRFSDILKTRPLLKAEILEVLEGVVGIPGLDKKKKTDLEEIALKAGIALDCKYEFSTGIDLYADELAAEKFAGDEVDPWRGNLDTGNGIDKEIYAIKCYEFANEVEVKKIGFVTDDEGTYGCSPDGLVEEDGQIETKCLMGKNHVKMIREHHETGKCPKEFYPQIQGQLFVCERKWCDLILYHDLLPLKIIRVFPDIEFHKNLKEAISLTIEKRDANIKILGDL